MKKVAFILSVLVVTAVAVRFMSDSEDTWLCENGGWVRHGNPAAPMPTGGCGQSPSPSVSAVPSADPGGSVEQAMKRALAEKYRREVGDIELTVNKNIGGYAQGSVSFAGEMGGALWFGADTEDGWVLVHDGQGPAECSTLEKYGLPKEFAPQCIDKEGILQTRT